MNIKTHRKLLKLDKDIGNPFPAEHEWLYRLINSYKDIDHDRIYALFRDETDFYLLKQQFFIAILEDVQKCYNFADYVDVHNSVEMIISLWKTDPTGSNKEKWLNAVAAAHKADSAAHKADSAAAVYAAYAAYAAADSASAYVASAAADAAEYAAADAAEYAALAYTEYAAADAASANNSATWSAAKQNQIELIKTLIIKYSH